MLDRVPMSVPMGVYGKYDVRMPEFKFSILVAFWIGLIVMYVWSFMDGLIVAWFLISAWVSVWYGVSWGRMSKAIDENRA